MRKKKVIQMKQEATMERKSALAAAAPIIGLMLLLGQILPAQTPAIKIVSPPDGTVVAPGQKVTMVVRVDPQSPIRMVAIGGPEPLDVAGLAFSPPYQFTFTIPPDMTPRSYLFQAIGSNEEEGEIDSDAIHLDVEKPSAITGLKVRPREIFIAEAEEPHLLSVTGTLDDGSEADLRESTRITYTSDNPEVATVNSVGMVTSVGPGKAKITVSAGAVSVVVPVSFSEGPPPGPETTLVLTPPPNAQGWNNTDIHASITTVDDALGSGIRRIGMAVAGNHRSHQSFLPGVTTASMVVTTEGDLRISAYATDNVGNVGHRAFFDVRVDKTPPSISGLPVPCTVRIDGNADEDQEERRVTVATITASDALSGLAEFEVQAEPEDRRDILITGSGLGPRTVEVRVEGGAHDHADRDRAFHLRARARDVAGNTASQEVVCAITRPSHPGAK